MNTPRFAIDHARANAFRTKMALNRPYSALLAGRELTRSNSGPAMIFPLVLQAKNGQISRSASPPTTIFDQELRR
jgi:hypothetical protein